MPAFTRGQAAREAVATGNAPAQKVLVERNTNARLRREASRETTNGAFRTPISTASPDEPPRFVIDLSRPPEQRYLEVCDAFRGQLQSLVPLFDEVVGDFMAPIMSSKWVHRLCRTFLRRIYDEEENRELKGISAATGVEMYLLVSFNVLLDLFMGCSSGGAAVRDATHGSKMVHFRTLDWGMRSLRKIVVRLDFKTEAQGPIVASSISYAGYVGVLTGVRKKFSVSLNFRPCRDDKYRFWSDAKYYWHLCMVLFGQRRSISSHLRGFLLPRRPRRDSRKPRAGGERSWSYGSYADIIRRVPRVASTACYLCFSNGSETTVMEKDRITAVVRTSEDFIVITNNDVAQEDEGDVQAAEESPFAGALAEIVHEAKDRRQCAEHNYHNARAQNARRLHLNGEDVKQAMDVEDVVHMVQKYPTTNEMTHFACVMDPMEGTVAWCGRWMKPVSAKWMREHASDTW